MSGSQDIDNLDDLEDEEEKTETPGNGTHAPGVPDIKITYPKANARGKAEPKIDGQEAFDAFAEKVSAQWDVTRESAPGYDKPYLVGNLPIKVTAEDVKAGRLHEMLGRGVYTFSHGKARYRVQLATLTPPKEFGTVPSVEAAAEWRWFYTPQGQPVQIPPGAPVPPGLFSAPPPAPPYGYGNGPGLGYPQQSSPADIARAIVDALRPFLEKKDSTADARIAIDVEKIRLDQARLDAEAKKAVAESESRARIAEAKAREEAEKAKSQREHDAEMERIKSQNETQKDIAKLNAEAFRDKMAGEQSWFDRFLAMQEATAPKEGDDELGKLDKLMRLADRIRGRTDGERSLAAEVLEGLPAVIKTAGEQLQSLRQPSPLVPQLAAPATLAQPGQPVATPPTSGVLTIDEFMTAIKTANEAILNGVAAERVLPLLKAQTPNMIAICTTKDPAAVLVEVNTLATQPQLDAQKQPIPNTFALPAESRAVLDQFKTLALGDGRGWLEAFFKLLKGV